MNNVMKKTDELIDAIQSSNEYLQYQMLQKTISKNTDLYNRLNDYRRRNFEIQMQGHDNAEDEIQNLANEYADILNQADIKDFLVAEQRYIKMLRRMNKKIDNQIHVNIEFLE
jgi:cell fate (sporulation/competence/biofilm development) regulator YlbF (YheA/YmcA/DUF963 family)